MTHRRELDERSLDRLTDFASRWTGFSRDAILPDAIRRAAGKLGGTGEELLLRASRADAAVMHALCQAVSVGETYFFRHPEHFRWIAHELIPDLSRGKRTRVSVWSAGCATGEEAYSAAACLLDTVPSSVTVDVLGTDLLERNLVAARAAVYGSWSQRPSAPLLHPLHHPRGDDRVQINDHVRAATRFESHNLLDPAPGGPYDVVLCRNVLVYFSPAAVTAAVTHLAAALAPGGALLFGPMDVSIPPPGLSSASLPELQIYRRREKRSPAPPSAPRPSIPPPPSLPRIRPPEPVALHLRALVHIERGDRHVAEKSLSELVRLVPEYVPGLLERALLHVRVGERNAAAALMREVLKRTERLAPDEMLAGPEPLPASFYRDSAQTYLRAGRGIAE